MIRKLFLNLFVFCTLSISCNRQEQLSNQEEEIRPTWKYRLEDDTCWQALKSTDTSLLRSEGRDEIEEMRTFFDVSPDLFHYNSIELSLKGLAVEADVFLNDTLIQTSDSLNANNGMVLCGQWLKEKRNVLRLRFHSHIPINKKILWRPLLLKGWTIARIEDLYLQPLAVSDNMAEYMAHYTIVSETDQSLSLDFKFEKKVVWKAEGLTLKKGINTGSFSFVVEKPKRWWSNGLGQSNLSSVCMSLQKGNIIIHQQITEMGMRNFKIVKKQSEGDAYYFELNGNPLYLKGADLCADQEDFEPDSAQSLALVASAKDANVNLIRVPARSGILIDYFYQLCDENGILVWQDIFDHLLPTSNQHNDRLPNHVLTDQIKALRNHPCLAVWRGIKENELPGAEGNGLPEWPEYVLHYSPHVPFVFVKWPFAQNPPRSLIQFSPMPLKSASSPLDTALHAFTNLDDATKNYIAQNYPVPTQSALLGYVTQVAQAEWLKCEIENQRILQPQQMGVLVGPLLGTTVGLSAQFIQANDVWKPAPFALKNAFSHVLVTTKRENGFIKVIGVSDALKDLEAILMVKLVDFKGQNLFVRQIPVDIKANSSAVLLQLDEKELLNQTDITTCCLVAELNQPTFQLSRNFLYFVPPVKLKLGKPHLEIRINKAVIGYNLIVRSDVFVKNLVFATSGRPCIFSENNIDVLPNQRTRISVTYKGTKDELFKDLKTFSLADLLE